MYRKIGFIITIAGVLAVGCSKKLEEGYTGSGNAVQVSGGSAVNSNIRIVGLCTTPMEGTVSASGTYPYPDLYTDHRAWQLQLNGKSINGIGDTIYFQAGQQYQPFSNAYAAVNPFSKVPYTIPDSSRGADGKARIAVNYIFSFYQHNNHVKDSVVTAVDTSVSNTAQDLYMYNNEFDLYSGHSGGSQYLASATGQLHVKAFPRAVSVSNPANFKIRIINLAHAGGWMQGPNYGVQAALLPLGSGGVSVSNAGFKTINPTLSNIPPGQASDYIELPYGTYQFRVMSSVNKLVPCLPDIPASYNQSVNFYVTSSDYSLSDDYADEKISYQPFRTFLPGGIYTIAVYDGLGQNRSGYGYPPYLQSGYKIIQDNTPSANITFSNIQWVNAMPGQSKLNLFIDGNSMGKLDFGNYSPYTVFTTGQHTVTVKDSSGTTLISQSFQLEAMNNSSIWAYIDQSDKPQISFVSNDMDMTNGGLVATSDYNCAIRFLNFCPDADHITFTTCKDVPTSSTSNPPCNWPLYLNGNKWNGSSQNLAFGAPRIDTSYFIFDNPTVYNSTSTGNLTGHMGAAFKPYPLHMLNAFVSELDPKTVIPGTAIPSLQPLRNPFIIDTTRYPSKLYDQWRYPNVDAGVYSAALIGRINTSDPAQQVRLIVVRHVQ